MMNDGSDAACQNYQFVGGRVRIAVDGPEITVPGLPVGQTRPASRLLKSCRVGRISLSLFRFRHSSRAVDEQPENRRENID